MALTTFGSLKDTLADWLATSITSPRWTDATRGIIVNRAIRHLARSYDLRYNEQTTTIALIAGTQNYALPSDYSRPFYVWYLDPVTAQIRIVNFQTKDQFDASFPNPALQANPSVFTVFGTNLQFGKVPIQALTVNFLYYNIPAELVNAADTNAFTTGCWEAVFDRSLVESAEYLIDDERLDTWLRKWKETESALVREMSRSRSTARVAQSVEPH